jgi:hypothetical protein
LERALAAKRSARRRRFFPILEPLVATSGKPTYKCTATDNKPNGPSKQTDHATDQRPDAGTFLRSHVGGLLDVELAVIVPADHRGVDDSNDPRLLQLLELFKRLAGSILVSECRQLQSVWEHQSSFHPFWEDSQASDHDMVDAAPPDGDRAVR